MSTELLRYFDARRETLLTRARELVEQESPTLDVAATTALAEGLRPRFEAAGAKTELHHTARGAHLVARLRSGSGSDESPIMLLGHIDTVWPAGTLARRPFRLEHGRAFGPGIFDMKSGVAVILAALEAIDELSLQPSAPITIVLSCDEESGSATSRDLIMREAEGCAAVFVLEPSLPGGKVKTARMGIANYEIVAHGVAAHAGLDPKRGVNAIAELAHQTVALQALNDLSSGITVNVGVVSGGTLPNVVAAEARAIVDVRFRTMDDAGLITKTIESLQPVLKGARLEIRGGINRPPLERTDAVISLFGRARGIAGDFGFDLGEGASGGASDGNFTSALGIPTLDGLGVEGDGAHAEHEHIVVADLPRRAALLTALLTTPLMEVQN